VPTWQAEPQLNGLFSYGSGDIGHSSHSSVETQNKEEMTMDIPKLAAVAVVTAALSVGSQTLAQPTTAPITAARPAGATLAIPELIERLSRDGYRDVREIKLKGEKLYKVTARDAQGRIREMEVDARTAEVLASEDDDDDK
jgi:negative regulator of sigma E activity